MTQTLYRPATVSESLVSYGGQYTTPVTAAWDCCGRCSYQGAPRSAMSGGGHDGHDGCPSYHVL